jgi:hypothetical protein
MHINFGRNGKKQKKAGVPWKEEVRGRKGDKKRQRKGNKSARTVVALDLDSKSASAGQAAGR